MMGCRRCRPADSAIPAALRGQETREQNCMPRLPVVSICRLDPCQEMDLVAPKVRRVPWRLLTLAMESQRVGWGTAAAAVAASEYRPAVLDRSRWGTADQNYSWPTKALRPIPWRSPSSRARFIPTKPAV